MRKIFILFLLNFLVISAFPSTNQDSILNAKFEILNRKVLKQDSIIHALERKTEAIEIKKDFFHDELSMQTSLFTLIVGILTFAIGFIIPYFLRKRFKKDFNKMKMKLAYNSKLLEKTNHKLSYEVSRLITRDYLNQSNMYETFIWSLKFLIAEYNYSGKNLIFHDNSYLLILKDEDYSNIVASIPNDKKQLQEDINEFNTNINIIMNLVNDKYKERIIDFQTRFNQIVWAKITELSEAENVNDFAG